MFYKVYRVQYHIAIRDPDMPTPRYHNVIFVETNNDGSGMNHQVAGDITAGMVYTSESSQKPDDTATFHTKELLGTVNAKDYPDAMEQVLRAQPPPPKQKHFNIKTMKTEQIKPDGSFYADEESRPPMIKCTEWTIRQAIPALCNSGMIHK